MMGEEYDILMQNNTWVLIPPSPQENLISCHQVYKAKHYADGFVDWYKACLIVKGFHQQVGWMDIGDAFSLVVKLTTIHVIFTLASMYDWSLR